MARAQQSRDAALLAAARLDGDRSLAVFRTLLEAVARPGCPVGPVTPGPEGLAPALLAALALVDLDHVVAVLGDVRDDRTRWSSLIAAATDAQPTDSLEHADVVIARTSPTAVEIASIRTGDAASPELGARLFIACDSVRPGAAHPVRFRLSGPGAPVPREVEVSGVGSDVPQAIAEANQGFPAGIDVWFLDREGYTLGVPRSSRIVPAELQVTTGSPGRESIPLQAPQDGL